MRVYVLLAGCCTLTGIRPGVTIEHIGLNIDVAPTIAAILGTTPPPEARIDGRSLEPLLFAADRLGTARHLQGHTSWRTDFLFEFWMGGHPGSPPGRGPYCHHMMAAWNNTYAGIRSATYAAAGHKYVDFSPYEEIQEAFDLQNDPYEMTKLVGPGRKGIEPPPQWVAKLTKRLAALRNCSEDSCRSTSAE